MKKKFLNSEKLTFEIFRAKRCHFELISDIAYRRLQCWRDLLRLDSSIYLFSFYTFVLLTWQWFHQHPHSSHKRTGAVTGQWVWRLLGELYLMLLAKMLNVVEWRWFCCCDGIILLSPVPFVRNGWAERKSEILGIITPVFPVRCIQ